MKRKTTDLFEKLAKQEREFFASEFLSPVVQGLKVRVRIAGVILDFDVLPEKYQGWGVFRAEDQKIARFLREPTLAEKQRYLDLYPRFSMIVTRQKDTVGIPANQSDARLTVVGQVPIRLPVEVQLFDTVDVRFDGQNFWYDSHSTSRSPMIAGLLRDALLEEREPDSIIIAGMSAEERMSYRLAYLMEIEAKKDRKEERIRRELERGGAVFKSYLERGNQYTVEYMVNDAQGRAHRHRSTVDADTLQVITPGICLTDHATGVDHGSDFDLQSLVSVIKEGYGIGRVVNWEYGRW